MNVQGALRILLAAVTGFSLSSEAQVRGPVTSQPHPVAISYTVSLSHAERHFVHVSIALSGGAPVRDMQLPVWNALYQVRDFSQFVMWVRARNNQGQPLSVRLMDKSRWRISGTGKGASVEYEIYVNDPGPEGAQLNSRHAFFNLAEILMYPVDARWSPVALTFTDLPAAWRTATALRQATPGSFAADNYDALVDSPVEIGGFQESDFVEGGVNYRVVVDADASDYDIDKIAAMARRIVAAETVWMNDRPFGKFLFIYHFPHGEGGGGMEHAYSTAIDVNARVAASDPNALPEVTAHEFFHVWNVKRIRPKSMEPVDYTKENYSSALWFSEGFTNTAQELNLLRAGFLDERGYLNRLATTIETVEGRPARWTQSPEESSLDAWLEKYSFYRGPERSVSYYDEGNLLGVALDLEVREASAGRASLRDVFRWMNENYARQGRFFPDTDGVRMAAEAASRKDLTWFFQKFVTGTEEIPWDDLFKTVGLRLERYKFTGADLGFAATSNFGAQAVVTAVAPESEAERAGLSVGDAILEIDGHAAGGDYRRQLAEVQAGEDLRLRVRSGSVERDVAWKVATREEIDFELKDLNNVSARQKARRTAWLKGEDEPLENQPSGGAR